MNAPAFLTLLPYSITGNKVGAWGQCALLRLEKLNKVLISF